MNRGLDWSTARAFASQVAEQGIHVNEAGAFAHGVVQDEEVPTVVAELTQRLLELVTPTTVSRSWTRSSPADVIAGPFALGPRICSGLPRPAIELSDTVAASSVLTDHRDRPWGYHHQDGSSRGRLRSSTNASARPRYRRCLAHGSRVAVLSVGLDGNAAHDIPIDEPAAATRDGRPSTRWLALLPVLGGG
jgi:hypothetical protein